MAIQAHALPTGKRKNLMRLVERVEHGLAPIHIAKILIFGSSLRGKTNPHDIDLVLVQKKDSELDGKVELLRQFVFEQVKTEEGRNSLAQLTVNADLANEFAKKAFPGLPVQKWLKYIKASPNMATYMPFIFDPAEITKKILKEGMHLIQIAKIVPLEQENQLSTIMTARKFEQIWSESDHDIGKAFRKIQRPSEQRDAIRVEMKNFLTQSDRSGAQYQVVSHAIRNVVSYIETHNAIPKDKTLRKYIENESAKRGIKPEFQQWILALFLNSLRPMPDEPPMDVNVTRADINKRVNDIISSSRTINDLSEHCEKIREEITLLSSKNIVSDTVLRNLIREEAGYESIPIKKRIELAVYRAFLDVAKYEADDETKRLVMKEVGLGEIARYIVLVERAYSRPWYHMARSRKELRELERDARKFGFEKQLVAYLNPILRRAIPRGISTFVSVSTGKAKGALIPEALSVRFSVEKDRCSLLEGFAKKFGAKIEGNAYECIATLHIDVRNSRGDKKTIKQLVQEKLGLRARI